MANQQAIKSTRGFASHPENINRKGQPRKGTSWKAVIEEALKQIEPKSGKTLKEIAANRIAILAATGNLKAIDMAIRLTEGYMPTKHQEVFYNELDDKTEEELIAEYEMLKKKEEQTKSHL